MPDTNRIGIRVARNSGQRVIRVKTPFEERGFGDRLLGLQTLQPSGEGLSGTKERTDYIA